MRPSQLEAGHFASYPSQARQIAMRGLDVLRRLPLSYAPLLLGEVIFYDSKFPAEQREVDAQFSFLRALSPEQFKQVMAGFERLALAPELEQIDWVRTPGEFSERLSAHLWTTGQIAAFRTAAVEFLNRVRAAVPTAAPPIPRLTIVIVGQGVADSSYRLFGKLRPHGTYYTRLNPQNGLRTLLDRAAARARKHPMPFAHWYVDGGTPAASSLAGMELLAYPQLDSIRNAVVARMRSMLLDGAGTEARRSALMRMVPEDFGLKGEGPARVRNHFKVTVLAEGSGVQFFSTTFVQWSAREVLRRAQPLTLVARFAPRMTERSMNDALTGGQKAPTLDAQGALVDADMGAYYTWVNQMRLPGADDSSFLVWFENHAEALVISPSSARGAESHEPAELTELLDQMRA